MGMKFLQLYFTYRDALDELSDEECGQLVKSLLQYAMDGVQPELPKHSLVRQTFLLMARQIDFDAGCYEKRSAGGKRGGRPKKTEKEPETESENQDADTEKTSETLDKPTETFEKQGFQKKPCLVEVMGGLSKKERKGKERNRKESSSIDDDSAKTTTISELLDFSVSAFKGSRVQIESSLSDAVDALGVDLTRAVLKSCASAGGETWAYVETAIKKCLASGITTIAEYEGNHMRETGKVVDRAKPSGNDFLSVARGRQLRLKRMDGT